MEFKLIKQGLTEEEFQNYCIDVSNNLEGNTFWENEVQISYSNIIRKTVYTEENDENITIYFIRYLNDTDTENLYNIYEIKID